MKRTGFVKTLSFASVALGAAACVWLLGCDDALVDDLQVQPSDWSEGVMQTSAWVMAGIGTSATTSSDALHLAYSTDGRSWHALNSNEATFTSTIGSHHIRDPYVFRANDGSFVLLAEDYTNDGQHTDFGADEDTDYGNNPSSRIYVAFSDDLMDALVVQGNGRYYLFARDARRDLITALGGDIQCASLKNWGEGQFDILGSEDSLTGDEGDWYINRGSKQTNVLWESEPCVYQLVDGVDAGVWIMLVNKATENGTMAAYKTTDIGDPTSWVSTTEVTKFTESTSYKTVGTSVTRITAAELEALKLAF